jgi:hypothetical protein
VYNPTDTVVEAELSTAMTFADARWVRLDENLMDGGGQICRDGNRLGFEVPARAIRSLRLR